MKKKLPLLLECGKVLDLPVTFEEQFHLLRGAGGEFVYRPPEAHTIFVAETPLHKEVRLNCGRAMDVHWEPRQFCFLPSGSDLSGVVKSGPEDLTAMRISVGRLRRRLAGVPKFEEVSLRPVLAQDDPVIAHSILAMRALVADGASPDLPLLLAPLANALAVRVATTILGHPPKEEPDCGNRIKRVLEFIEDNLHRPIELADLAAVAALSEFYFLRLFKKAVGRTPHAYLVERRVLKAKLLLDDHRVRLVDVAYACGFSSQSHFSTVFKRVTGVTPSAYRGARRS